MEFITAMQISKMDAKLVQRTMNESLGIELKIDGDLGPTSRRALAQYQAKFNLVSTGTLDDPTWSMMRAYIDARFVTVQKVAQAALSIDLDPAALLAIWEVESLGEGFLPSGLCVILFERHIFYKYAKVRLGVKQADEWRKKFPDLCHPVWDASFYYGGAKEWDRLGRASALDATCALLAVSWGLFQTMGFNYALAGYEDVQSMVAAFQESESHQLTGLVKFIKAQPKLYAALRNKNFTTVARIYNGPAYAKHGYHIKMAKAHDRWASQVF